MFNPINICLIFIIGEDVGVPQMSKTLNSNSPVCFDVELRIDDVIEEIETATLSLELTNESGITEVSPSTTTIIIEDNSCEYFLEKYMFS